MSKREKCCVCGTKSKDSWEWVKLIPSHLKEGYFINVTYVYCNPCHQEYTGHVNPKNKTGYEKSVESGIIKSVSVSKEIADSLREKFDKYNE